MSNTNADDKLIGFEYQFFYFLLSLLQMKTDDIVGFEVQEDVHIENDNKLILCQLKHSIQTNSQGKIKNLTTADNDLWKTLSLWIDKIKKLSDISKLNNMSFVFISNKAENEGNTFLEYFKSFKENQDIEIFKKYLNNYKNELEATYNQKFKTDPKTKKDKKIIYLENILSIDDKFLKDFFIQMSFELGLDDIINKIKEVLKNEKYISSKFRIDRTFESLIGILKEDFYIKVKAKKSVQYTSEEFFSITKSTFNQIRGETLLFIEELDNFEKDTKILERTFAKQLKNMNVEEDEIYEYDYQRELTLTNLKELLQSNEISEKDIENLDKNTIDNWKPIFEEIYLDEEYTNKMSKKVLIKIKQLDLNLSGILIPNRRISNGQFMILSDIPKIGWQYNWKEEYKEDE